MARSAPKPIRKAATGKAVAAKAKSSARIGQRTLARTARKTPIDLYYWPTPNGFKISIMLEECRLPYTMIPVNIARGDQFKPEFLAISPNNRMPAIVDRDGPGGRPISIFESGAILQYLGRKTGQFYPRRRARPRRGRAVALLADGQSRAEGRGGHALPSLCRGGEAAIRHRPLHQRDEPHLRRHEHALAGPRIPRRQVFDRRHGLRRLGQSLPATRPGPERFPAASSAGSRRCARGPRSIAASTCGSRRPAA